MMFARWCEIKKVPSFPTAPGVIAKFIEDCTPLGIATVWPEIEQLSRRHLDAGLSDPTAGGVVSAAINRLSGVEAPRSWVKEEKQRFMALPYPVQIYIIKREADRDRGLAQAMQRAADVRKEYEALKSQLQTRTESNGQTDKLALAG